MLSVPLAGGGVQPLGSGRPNNGACRMTREELQKRLAESAFGRNQIIFDAYFKWSGEGGQQPYCVACMQPIGHHGEQIAPPAASTPPPASSPQGSAGFGSTLNPAAYHGSHPQQPPPSGPQPIPNSSYEHMINGSSSVMPSHYGLYHQGPQPGSVMYTQPSPSYVPQLVSPYAYGVPIASPTHSASIGLPSKLVTGRQGAPDTVTEPFSGMHLIVCGILALLMMSSIATAVGLLQSDGGAKARTDDPYAFVSSGWWFLCLCVYAFRCKRFVSRIQRGESIECQERRLLTFIVARTVRIQWIDVVQGGNVEVCADGDSVVCCCMSPSWAMIALRANRRGASSSTGALVPLARCPIGMMDVELGAWTNYIAMLRGDGR